MFCKIFHRPVDAKVSTIKEEEAEEEEEGRGTRNGYEASKGSKGISGL